ncbi:hypothetical protein HanIR_Chr13g0654561 [Helianthus annuus]|nr:hypothetical protein HanIR_Chr13g0654561 [Helianthus annuus]
MLISTHRFLFYHRTTDKSRSGEPPLHHQTTHHNRSIGSLFLDSSLQFSLQP